MNWIVPSFYLCSVKGARGSGVNYPLVFYPAATRPDRYDNEGKGQNWAKILESPSVKGWKVYQRGWKGVAHGFGVSGGILGWRSQTPGLSHGTGDKIQKMSDRSHGHRQNNGKVSWMIQNRNRQWSRRKGAWLRAVQVCIGRRGLGRGDCRRNVGGGLGSMGVGVSGRAPGSPLPGGQVQPHTWHTWEFHGNLNFSVPFWQISIINAK